MMKPGRAWHPFAAKIIKAVSDYSLSEKFHWTPKQIAELDYKDRMVYLSLMKGAGEAKE